MSKPMTTDRRRALDALSIARQDFDTRKPGTLVTSAWGTFRRAKEHAAIVSALVLLDDNDAGARSWAEAMRLLDIRLSTALRRL